MAHRVTLIPGDGIGPEIAAASRRALEATGVEFDWDVQGANRFDFRAAKLTTLLAAEQVLVTSVEVTDDGSLTVFLSGGLRIEAPCGESGSEDWRFFRPHRDEGHVVMPPEG